MAAKRSAIILLAAVALVALLPAALCQKAAPAPEAAAPAAPNVTAVLEKGGQYTKFMRLMKSTQQDTQLNAQANGSDTGFTVFAPTDNAFDSLKAGTLNSLTQQEQVSLVQAHILPTFYSMESFETASNPVRTQASGADGPYTVNVTATSNSNVNVSTGLVSTVLGSALRATRPLAVYSIDKVLLPYDLFGPKPPASSPPAPGKKPSTTKGGVAAPAGAEEEEAPPAGAAAAVGAGWSLAAVVAAACLL
ncbi:fasciclin-like arabinogalactan protein 9 [Lolium rigidum]|uniref:fasciclin-like arabinogalactan protein 9 n=1 Tax=Lolium rigidum TaxID=89674 RepID=UPI001F5DBFDE|nr:fasciclin-like arabinogalactan protein 9 [Lolium rigidum]